MASSAIYRRVLLKISGEALMGDKEFGLDPGTVDRLASEIASVHALGVEVSVVIGGGNIFRGVSGAAAGIELATAHHIGMLATVINALAIQNALEKIEVQTRVQSAIQMDAVCERYIRRRAARHMEKGRVVIFAAGTGNPFFTTDTGAALRAVEMNCDAMLKATQVDGVYSADPKVSPGAVRYDHLTYRDVLSLARENRIPILVFSIDTPGAFVDILRGQGHFTVISDQEETGWGVQHG